MSPLHLRPAVRGLVIDHDDHVLMVRLVFPHGAFLMTGTGVVPDSDFTLRPGDIVHITIDHVGTLTNTIIQSSGPRG
jgi:fumarylacetoacetate (FAA) hydrolase family protein